MHLDLQRSKEQGRKERGVKERDTGQNEGRGRRDMIGERRGEEVVVERKEEGGEKTQRNSTTFPHQKHSAQSTVVSPSVWAP